MRDMVRSDTYCSTALSVAAASSVRLVRLFKLLRNGELFLQTFDVGLRLFQPRTCNGLSFTTRTGTRTDNWRVTLDLRRTDSRK
jgi:hypothetical protein